MDITADRTGAGSAFLGEQVTEAVETVDEVVSRREPLANQLPLAADADEAFLVPGLVPVIHTTCGDGLKEGSCKTLVTELKESTWRAQTSVKQLISPHIVTYPYSIACI